MSALVSVEVPSAIWRKARTSGLSRSNATVLTRQFEIDYRGTTATPPKYDAIAVTQRILTQAASLVVAHPLRAYDAVQLASALAAKVVDPSLDRFCVYDQQLSAAASLEGFVIVQ